MNWDPFFQLANALALTGWLILVAGPRGPRWLQAIPAAIIPLLLSVGYLWLIALHFAASGGGYGSLAEVRALLAGDAMLLAGWVHYLAFDLLIGAWIATQLDRAGTLRWIQTPILLATLLFGPVGFLLYCALAGGGRAARPRLQAG